MLWLVMEEVCPKLQAAYVVLFSENSPTIGWVIFLSVRGSLVPMQIFSSTNATIKKGWGITVDTFAHCWGRKCYDGYSIMLVWQ